MLGCNVDVGMHATGAGASLGVVTAMVDGTTATIEWDAPPLQGGSITAYDLELSDDGVTWQSLVSVAASHRVYADETWTIGRRYRVAAKGQATWSAAFAAHEIVDENGPPVLPDGMIAVRDLPLGSQLLISDWTAGQSSGLVSWNPANVRASEDDALGYDLVFSRAAYKSRAFSGAEIQWHDKSPTFGRWAWYATAPRMFSGGIFGLFTYADNGTSWCELDFEFVGADTTHVRPNVHMRDASGAHREHGSVPTALGFDAADGPHLYEAELTLDEQAIFSIDGVEIARIIRADMPNNAWSPIGAKQFADFWATDANHGWTGDFDAAGFAGEPTGRVFGFMRPEVERVSNAAFAHGGAGWTTTGAPVFAIDGAGAHVAFSASIDTQSIAQKVTVPTGRNLRIELAPVAGETGNFALRVGASEGGSDHCSIQRFAGGVKVVAVPAGTAWVTVGGADGAARATGVSVKATDAPALVRCGPVEGLSVDAGDRTATLAWTAPATLSPSSADRWIVEVVFGGIRDRIVIEDLGATSFVHRGLTNGATYEYRVYAQSDQVGDGLYAASVSAIPVAPATVPAAVTGLTLAAGNGSLTARWDAPADGGSPITDYVVETRSAGGSWRTFVDGVSTAASTTITGLSNGSAVEVRVSAKNAVGTGAPSNAVTGTPANPTTVPGRVTDLVLSVGDRQLSARWTAPADGGSPITDYVVETRTDGESWTVYDDGASAATSTTITGLANGVACDVRVAARNAGGSGEVSAVVSATPVAPAVTLEALSLYAPDVYVGDVVAAIAPLVAGRTTGSTLTMSPATIESATASISLTEALSNAANGPRTTSNLAVKPSKLPTWNNGRSAYEMRAENEGRTASWWVTYGPLDMRLIYGTVGFAYNDGGEHTFYSVVDAYTAGDDVRLGLINDNGSTARYPNSGACVQFDGGVLRVDSAKLASFGTPAVGDVISVKMKAGKVWFRRNDGPWNADAAADPDTGTGGFAMPSLGTVYPVFAARDENAKVTTNFRYWRTPAVVPVNISAPTATGTPQVGETAVMSSGTWV